MKTRQIISLSCVALALAASPLVAQSDETQPRPAPENAPGGLLDGLPNGLPEGLMERLFGLADPFFPLLEDLGQQIEDLQNYHPPEILPNGDIIIRKRLPSEKAPKRLPESPEAAPDPDEMIEL